MGLAVEVATRSNCFKNQVGAILLEDDRIRAVGYNGTVEGYADCFAGGCPRCKDPKVLSGTQLDRCICVHAEENALISAARFGIRVEGAECYVTHEPCLSCTKLIIQAHVARVVYLKDYQYPSENESDHDKSRKAMRHSTVTEFVQLSAIIPTDQLKASLGRWDERLGAVKMALLATSIASGVFTPID
jgi:dCMP deaminase